MAATYDGSQMRIYKNGVEIASVAKTGAIDTDGSVEAALGNQPIGAGSEPFAGLLDDVCIYDRALDAAELSDIMSSGCGSGTVPPTPTPTNTPAPPTATPPPGSEVARIQRITYTLSGKMIGVRVVELDENDVVLSDELTYMLTNHLGSVMAISDDAGNMVGDIVRHEPFGDYWGTPPDETNPDITDRGFTNQKHNNELELIYYGARYYMPNTNRMVSPDTIVPDPTNPQSFNRYSYALNNPVNYKDPSGHYECKANTDCAWMSPTEDYLFNRAYEKALWFYQNNFGLPFEGKQRLTQEFGSDHNGVDWGGNMTVVAPYEVTVKEAGLDSPAGMWRIKNHITGEIREWSIYDTNTHGKLYHQDRDDNGFVLPELLLASGEWEDLEPGWSHVRGTEIEVAHDYNLATIYYHTNPLVNKGSFVSKGDILGETANTGFSTGTHLHQTVTFTYKGQRKTLSPLTVSNE